MANAPSRAQHRIVTPDRRLRVYVSSTLPDGAPERQAVARAVADMRMSPVTAASAARPHPSAELSRRYVEQCDVFIAVYADPDAADAAGAVALAQDEFRTAEGMPRLVYVSQAHRTPALDALLDAVRDSGDVSYRDFTTASQLGGLIADDLAVLLTERFTETQAEPSQPHGVAPTLPVTLTSFVGRRRELRQVEQLLRDPAARLVTLIGPGGVGKTRLALEAGKAVEDEFPDGAVVLWLDGMRDPTFFLQALAAELQVKETAESSVLQALGNRLRGHRMLILLDNFEHMISAATSLSEVIALPTASKFLVTSRELLHIRGEHAVELEPLPLPDGEDQDALASSDAVELFVDRAAVAAPGFTLTPQNAAAVAAIVRRLEGVPLALELAAARVRMLPPAALLRRLTTSLDLGHGGRDLPSRQQTLRATVDWSYQLLDDRERSALERLSVFPANATVDAALDVLEGIPGGDPLDLLESLLRKSLVRRTEDAHGVVHLSLLVAVREFAGERLAARGDEAVARQRHAAYYGRIAEAAAADVHSARQRRHLEAIDDALENIAGALEWYAHSGDADAAWGLANTLRWYWILRGHLSAADRWLRRLLALPGGDDRLHGHVLTTAGMIALAIGDLQRARELFESATDIMTASGDRAGLAWAQTGLGETLRASGAFADAQRLQEAALFTFRSDDDLVGQCTANTRIGNLFLGRGDYEAAEERFRGSLAVRREIGDPWGTSYVLTALASLRLLAGDYDQAEEFFDEALALVRSIGHADGIARALDGLGTIAAAHGRWNDAAGRFAEAAALFGEVGNRASTALALAHQARAELENDQAAAATEHAMAAYGIAKSTASSPAVAAAAEVLGCVLADDQDSAVAATLFGAAAGLRERHRIPEPPDHPLGPRGRLQAVREALGPEEDDRCLARGAALKPRELAVLISDAADSLL